MLESGQLGEGLNLETVQLMAFPKDSIPMLQMIRIRMEGGI